MPPLSRPLALLLFVLPCSAAAPTPVVSFAVVSDIHYANAPAIGTRYYNNSLDKLEEALTFFNSSAPEGAPASFIVELGDFKDCNVKDERDLTTEGYLRTVEALYDSFVSPHFHVLGNHDFDTLNATELLDLITSTGVAQGARFYSLVVKSAGLRLITLDADFHHNASSGTYVEYNHEDNSHNPFKWTDAWVPPNQLTWLETQLEAAAADGQKVVVLTHQRLDGCNGHNTSAFCAWVDDCTITNAPTVRSILERTNATVLAALSGHDHTGALSPQTINGVFYYTVHGMIEGEYPGSNAYAAIDVLSDCTVVVVDQTRGQLNNTASKSTPPPGCSLP